MNSLPQKTVADNSQQRQTNPIHNLIFKLSVLLIIVTSGLIGIYLLPIVMHRVGDAGVKTVDKTFAVFNKHLGSKEQFNATFGPIISERQLNRLQFHQRNQVCLFRIVRYRGHDNKNYNHTEYYKKEADKKSLEILPILLDQYCEWLAKGTYEFNFYIDMSDLSKWGYKWDPERYILTLFPPDIEANTPAELEPLVFTCISDSVSIDETYTRKQLKNAVPELKQQLAVDQKRFMYDEAKVSIKKLYRQFLLNLVPTSAHNNQLPNIIIRFPHEVRRATKSRQKSF